MKKLGCFILFGATILGVSGCSGSAKPAESQKTENRIEQVSAEARVLTLAHGFSNGPQFDAVKEFADAVKEDSDGRIIIEVKDSGVMGTETEILDQVRLGAIEMGLIAGANHQSIEPKTAIEELPYVFSDHEEAYAAMDGGVGNILKALLEKKGIVVLAWWENGFRQMTNNKRPIINVEDMRGLKIRSAEVELRLDMFNALGASAIPMAGSEVFTALSQGTVDGQENPEANIYAYKFHEVQKYLSLTNHIWGSYALEINKDVWDGMTESEKRIISDNAIKYRDIERKMVRDSTDEYRKKIEEAGVAINEVADLNSFREACSGVYEKWSKVFGEDLMNALSEHQK